MSLVSRYAVVVPVSVPQASFSLLQSHMGSVKRRKALSRHSCGKISGLMRGKSNQTQNRHTFLLIFCTKLSMYV